MTPKIIDWSSRFDFGSPRSTSNLQAVFIHTTENRIGTPAENVANYQIGAKNGSYHYLADASGKLLRENTDDWVAWGTGNRGNDVGLHISFVANAALTRAQWIANMPMLRAAAWQVARWCRAYGIPAQFVTPSQLRGGIRGISTHDGARQAWGVTDHTDPGPNFPMDVFINLVKQELNPTPAPAPKPAKETEMALTPEQDRMLRENNTLLKEIRYQLTGSTKIGEFPGLPQSGGRTLYDLASATAEIEGVTGTKDIKER